MAVGIGFDLLVPDSGTLSHGLDCAFIGRNMAEKNQSGDPFGRWACWGSGAAS